MNAPSPAAAPRRIPTEFRYWERLPDPRSQRLREGFRKLLHFDPVLDDTTVRRYAETYFDADPVAEAFVEEVYLQRGQAEGRAGKLGADSRARHAEVLAESRPRRARVLRRCRAGPRRGGARRPRCARDR